VHGKNRGLKVTDVDGAEASRLLKSCRGVIGPLGPGAPSHHYRTNIVSRLFECKS